MTPLPPSGALSRAVQDYDVDSARELLEQGADPDERNDVGSTPLLYAASRSRELVELLVNYGADINARNQIGAAPIFAPIVIGAARPDNATFIEILHFLIQNGADLDVKLNGNTPLQQAVNMGNKPAEKLIRNTLRNRKRQATRKIKAEQKRLSDIHNAVAARQKAINSRRPKANVIRKNTPA